ncbi:MAG: HP0495 family protein [Planctomycetota bacterium]|jgi:putative lipoic acid-binding regulatory protein
MSKPEINYPCEWGFRIIGTHEKLIRQLVAEVLGDRPHGLEPSNTSATGRYVSMSLRVEVENEEDRTAINDQLMADESVKIVL